MGTRTRFSSGELERIVCAYLLDRADQYETSSPCWIALSDAAGNIMSGEHIKSWKEGEFDAELMARVDAMKGRRKKDVDPKLGSDCAYCGQPYGSALCQKLHG